jgi:hypothetical protein
MRCLAPCGFVALVLLGAGCGSPHTLSIRDVERTFLSAGVPFETEQRPNSYLRPITNPIGLPGPRGAQRAAVAHVQAVLGFFNNTNFNTRVAYVFDSTRSADEAVRTFPLSKWMTSNRPVIRAQIENVIILAVPATRGVRRAMAALEAR